MRSKKSSKKTAPETKRADYQGTAKDPGEASASFEKKASRPPAAPVPDKANENSQLPKPSPAENEMVPRSVDLNILPDLALSDSLRSAAQNLEAPVWQFSCEEALKPVERKRRRKSGRKPTRTSSRKKAPLMTPGSAPTLDSGTKRKLIDLTDFKTPSLSEPETKSKRIATSDKTSAKESKVNPTGENKQGSRVNEPPPI